MQALAQLPSDAIERLAQEWPGVSLVVVFGSVAKGGARPDSDVDVGVLGGAFWDQLAVGSDLSRFFGREPHVVDLASASDWLRFEVARDGARVYERAPGAWTRFQAEAMVRYFDIAPIIARCAEGVRRRLAREAAEKQHG